MVLNEGQARHADGGEVVAVADLPGALAGTLELADLHVGDQVRGRTFAITTVQEREVTVAVEDLVAGADAVAADGIGEEAAEGAVVDFALGHAAAVVAAADVAVGTAGTAAVLAVGAAVEGAQVGLQDARANLPVVDQAEEVLLVEVVQVAVVVLQGQVLVDLVVATRVVELVAVARTGAAAVGAGDAQAAVVGGVTALGVLQLAGNQGEVLEVGRGDLAALEGDRQQAAVVVGDHRQLRLQGAVAELGVGHLGLGGQAQAGEVVHRLAVAFQREHGARLAVQAALAGTAAAVQAHAEQAQRVDAEADGALGEARLVIQDEALAPLFLLARRGGAIAVVGIDVEVAQGQRCLAVLDETGGDRLLRQGTEGTGSDGQGQS